MERDVLELLASINFYTHQIQTNANFFANHFSIENILLSGVFVIASIILYKRLIVKNQSNIIRIKMAWILFLMYFFLYGFGSAMTRIAAYICPVYLLLLSDIVECFGIRFKRLIRIVITAILLVLMYVIVTYNNYIPYAYRISDNNLY